MQYDFDTLTNREHTFSLKWATSEEELPMWVADMDFETAPAVIAAIQKKSQKGIFGYTTVPQEYFTAICNWWKKKHHFPIEKEWILFTTGVVPAISSIIRKMTSVGDNIVVQPPVYNIFYNSITNNNRVILPNNLVFSQGEYQIDFIDLEKKLADPKTTMMILCNPHNPLGVIWSKEILLKISELCQKHSVLVISDEIHCDITSSSMQYTPFASISEQSRQNSITCISASKAFNLAGLQGASVVVPNDSVRALVERGINTDEVAEPNAFVIDGTIAAFTEGEEWLEALCEYIEENKKIVKEYCEQKIPQVQVLSSQATYLLWLDCSKITDDSHKLAEFIQKETGLILSAGSLYGGNGNLFLRMNVATQKVRVLEGLQRLEKAVIAYMHENMFG